MSKPVQEATEAVGAFWNSIQGDPELIEGLTAGAVMDFFEDIAELMPIHPEHLHRSVPLGLLKRLVNTEAQPFGEQIEVWKEYLRVPMVRKFLDDAAGR